MEQIINGTQPQTLRFLDKFKLIIREFQRQQQINKTIKELNQLTDRELSDIGLNRGMIRSVAMEQYFDNRL